jgi:prepilin-type N-terminal cleavage/methylation domain-containing protein
MSPELIGKRSDIADRRERGMTLIELLIVIGILAALVLLAAPLAGKIIRRANDVGAYASLRQVLASARLQAVKRQANVVVQISLDPEKRIRLYTFQDRANDDTNPLPADEAAAAGNFKQETSFIKLNVGEPTLGEVILAANVRLWKFGGTPDDLTAAVGFDEYNGDATLTNRIAFTPSGGIAPPEDTSTSALPTASGGRGIYFADYTGKNFFRVTIDSNFSGKLRIDKYVEGTGFTTTGWAWR